MFCLQVIFNAGSSAESRVELIQNDVYCGLCFFWTGVCLPSDSVFGKPLLTGATGSHGPEPYLHPWGQAAESSLDSSNHWKPPKPKCKSHKKKRTFLSAKSEGESVFNLRAGRRMMMFVHINPDRLSKHSKTKRKRDLFIVSEGLISLLLRLSPPPGTQG